LIEGAYLRWEIRAKNLGWLILRSGSVWCLKSLFRGVLITPFWVLGFGGPFKKSWVFPKEFKKGVFKLLGRSWCSKT